jgi:hypothetical protein
MPLYPPRIEPVKKKQIVEKRITELLHSIKHGLSDNKIQRAAQALIYAQLKLCKAKIENIRYLEDSEVTSKQLSNVLEEENLWNRITTDEVIRNHGRLRRT